MVKTQQTILAKLDAWHNTTLGYFVFSIVELLIAYGFISWAIDSGQLWQYLIGSVLAVGSVQNAVKLIKGLLIKK